MRNILLKILEHPLTKGLSIDSPQTTALRKRIILEKRFLRKLYGEWYAWLIQAAAAGSGRQGALLELGAGGGFFKQVCPDCISSEIFYSPGVDMLLDAQRLPFKSCSLRSIILVDVLHHIPDVEMFFSEAQRVLIPGGVIAMIEPWNTLWGRFIYQKLHHEPFLPEMETWALHTLEAQGPLSKANGAIPWMVFKRDKEIFEQKFSNLSISEIRVDYPFSYLVSGGVSMRSLSPGWSFRLWRYFEKLLTPFIEHLGMLSFITIHKKEV